MSNVLNLVTNVPQTGTDGPPTILDGNFLAAGTTRTLTYDDNRAIIKLDTAGGTAVTLPYATGSGCTFKFVVSVAVTGGTNKHIVKCGRAADHVQGIILSMDDTSANAVAFAAVAGTDDSVSLAQTTTGGITKGEWLEFMDFAANVWQVRGQITNTGSSATPFTNIVS